MSMGAQRSQKRTYFGVGVTQDCKPPPKKKVTAASKPRVLCILNSCAVSPVPGKMALN